MGTSRVDGIENGTWHMMLLSRTRVASPPLDWKKVTITVTRQIYLYRLRYRIGPQLLDTSFNTAPFARARTPNFMLVVPDLVLIYYKGADSVPRRSQDRLQLHSTQVDDPRTFCLVRTLYLTAFLRVISQ